MSGAPLSVAAFCLATQDSDAPLSSAEIFTLAQLLRRGGGGDEGDQVDTSLLLKVKKGELLSMPLR